MNLVSSSHSGLFAEPPLSPTPLASAAEPPAAPLPAAAPAPVVPMLETPPVAAAPVEPAAPSERRADLPIEAQLVRMGLLTLEQLAEANRTRLENGGTVAEIVVANGWVTPEQIAVLTGDAAPEPVDEAPAPVADVFSPPPALEPAPEPAPVLRVAEPTPEPAPVLVSPTPAPPVPVESHPVSLGAPAAAITFSVALGLTGGERVDVAAGLDEATAKARAKEIVSELGRLGADEWPSYAGRFVRPDAILSVDVFQDG